jgi:putative transposase
LDLLNIPSMEMLRRSHKEWVEESLTVERSVRDGRWPESMAVGSKELVAMVKNQPSIGAKGQKIAETASECQLRETECVYSTIFGVDNGLLSSNNVDFWSNSPFKTTG